MPQYYFHLSFGSRVLPDDDGVELPNRAVAHQEATAVVRELVASTDLKRFSGWFLQVRDRAECFLRLPIGRPALEGLLNSPHKGAGVDANCDVVVLADARARIGSKRADRARQLLIQLEQTLELMERTQQLSKEHASETHKIEQNLVEARHLLSRAWGL